MIIAFENIYNSISTNNIMFDETNITIGANLSCPMIDLKRYAERNYIQVCTPDMVEISRIDKFVFIDQPNKNNKPCYLIIAESPIIWPQNFNKKNHKYFIKIFTYDDKLIDNIKYFKINYSYQMPKSLHKDISKKEKLCALISNNKYTLHKNELYSERIKAIKWFEKNAPFDFDLYGIGWDIKEFKFRGFILFRALNRIPHLAYLLRKQFAPKFTSYICPVSVEMKKEILKKYKFSICYENVKDCPGYISEKIFDSFFASCIPIYRGADNITDHIPEDCFIDLRKFKNYKSLYNYIKNMEEKQYVGYLNNIENYLNSNKAYEYTTKCYAETLINEITKK